MNGEVAHYLLILADRRAIAWVLESQQMAFPPTARAEVRDLKPGDELFIYITRGAYQNPSRDRGRVVGRATAVSAVEWLPEAVKIGPREFPRGCKIDVHKLAPWGAGVELVPLLARMEVFPVPQVWSAKLRRPMLRIPASDAALLREELSPWSTTRDEALSGYVDRATVRPTGVRAARRS
ncbi:hypothetical protein [Nonomuraea glycinis]|uniref:hypothetical protein n=1 Tax=Nonomuraea glycinis TaxID=2047744 RepID=UPI00339E3962